MAAEQHRKSVAVLTLIVVLLILTVIAAVGAAVLILTDRFTSAASPWVSPLSAIKAGAINPALALRPLSDTPDQTVVDEALAAGSSETALAALLYSTSLDDQTRAAGLLTLATRFAGASQKERAALAARTAVDVAILSPTMPDYNRVASLAQAAQILAGAGKSGEAIHALSTAAVIAQHSGRIDSSYRQRLLEGLASDAGRMGRKDVERELRAALNSELPALDTTRAVLPKLLIPLTGNGNGAWSELDAATAERISLARALIASLEGNSPTPSETVRQSLEKALVREDRLREQVYGNGITQGDNLLQRVAYARARMDWLALKWRVARQGFGMALVPAWESQERDIEANLQDACDDYFVILRDAAISLPSQSEAVQGALDAIQDQIKLGRLGLPPYAQEGELVRALDRAVADRMNLGLGNMHVTVTTVKGISQLTVIHSQ